METFQMGKELGSLEARVSVLEKRESNCKSAGKKSLPKAQQIILNEIKEKRTEISAGFNDVLKKLKLSDRVKVGAINLVDIDVQQDDEDQCCMSCNLDGQSGWQYCCDYAACSTCC